MLDNDTELSVNLSFYNLIGNPILTEENLSWTITPKEYEKFAKRFGHWLKFMPESDTEGLFNIVVRPMGNRNPPVNLEWRIQVINEFHQRYKEYPFYVILDHNEFKIIFISLDKKRNPTMTYYLNTEQFNSIDDSRVLLERLNITCTSKYNVAKEIVKIKRKKSEECYEMIIYKIFDFPKLIVSKLTNCMI